MAYEDFKYDWQMELETKYLHLFELYQEEDNRFHRNGKPIRGIETGSGWAKHIEKFLESCEWIRTNNGEHSNIQIFQIKEKFGQCRCYASCDGNEIQQRQLEVAIGKLEAKCSLTCEKCGKMDYNMIKGNNGWVYCLCDDCKSKGESGPNEKTN